MKIIHHAPTPQLLALLKSIRAEKWSSGPPRHTGDVVPTRRLRNEEEDALKQMLTSLKCGYLYRDSGETGIYQFRSMPMHIDCIHAKDECTLMVMVKGRRLLSGYQQKGTKSGNVEEYFERELDRREGNRDCRVIAFNNHLPYSFISHTPARTTIFATASQEFFDVATV